MAQLGRKAIDPPGDARADLWIINELARGIGLDWHYTHPREVFEEMRTCMDSIAGITWDRLERESSVTYPCKNEGDPGEPVVFVSSFPTPTGRASFTPTGSTNTIAVREPSSSAYRSNARDCPHTIRNDSRSKTANTNCSPNTNATGSAWTQRTWTN